MAAVLTGSAITNREACLRTSGGGRIPVLFSAALMQQGHHEARLVMTVRDITELNQMKNELARARDTALASTRHKQSRGSDSDVPGWSRRIKPLRRADLAEIVGGGRESGELAESRPDADCVPLRPGLHALVVEDNPVNQRVITGLLKKKGYRVTVAASGEESDARRANALSSF
jgi:hypothetical protein